MIVLTGTDLVFSAGVDFKNPRNRNPVDGEAPLERLGGRDSRCAFKLVIAAVNGACVSGALELRRKLFFHRCLRPRILRHPPGLEWS